MHKLLVSECLKGAKSVCLLKCFGLYLLKQGHSHRLIHVMDLCLKLLKQYYTIEQMCSDVHSITLREKISSIEHI